LAGKGGRWLAFVVLLGLAGAAAAQTSPLPEPVPWSDRSILAILRNAAPLRHAVEQQGIGWGAPVFLRIYKESRELEVWLGAMGGYRLFRAYPICRVSGGLGPKLREGDRQAPEGFYVVPARRLNPESAFHLSFDLGYPNVYDRALRRTGSRLMVHGGCQSAGCFAVTDPAMDEIWTLIDAAFRAGEPSFQVHVFPFRMTEGNLARHAGSPWQSFWRNLKEGHDLFEQLGWPPGVTAVDGRYVFYAG